MSQYDLTWNICNKATFLSVAIRLEEREEMFVHVP